MNFVERLKNHEGFRKKMYKDSVGVPTIGYGFNLEEIELPKPVAELWLSFEIDEHKKELKTLDWYNSLDSDRKDIILDMHYNLGHNRLLQFKNMIAAIKNEDYELAAKEMLDSKWADQVGRRATDLAALMKGDSNSGI